MDLHSVLDPSDINPRNPLDINPRQSIPQVVTQGENSNLKISLDKNVTATEADLLRQAYVQRSGHQTSFRTMAACTPELTCTAPIPPPPAYQRNKSPADHLLERNAFMKEHYMENMGVRTLPEANLEPLLQGDDWRRTLLSSPGYPYYGCKTEMTAMERALLASEAGESPEYIRALLMSDSSMGGSFRYDDCRVADATMRGNDSMHHTFSGAEWEAAARRVGKSQSMRAFSTFNEENELLRHAFYAMRRCQEQPSVTAPANTESHLFDKMLEARIRSMRDAYQMRPYTNCHNGYHSTPVFNGGVGNPTDTFGFYDHGGQHGQGMFYRQEDDMIKSDWKMHTLNPGVTTPQVPLIPFYSGSSRFTLNPSFPYGYCGTDVSYAGHHFSQGKTGAEEQQHNRRMVRPVEPPEKSQSMRYNNISFSDDFKNERKESCAKIDGTRSQSMREMAQCETCGQRLRLSQDDEVISKVVPVSVRRQQQQQQQQQQLCSTCNRSGVAPIDPLLRKTCASVPRSAPTASSSSSAAQGFLSAPPPSTIAMGCRPSANKKKKIRIIQLCRQFLGLPIKT